MTESAYKNNGFVKFIFEFVDFTKENSFCFVDMDSLCSSPFIKVTVL